MAGLVPVQQRGQDAAEGMRAGHLVNRRDRAADVPAALVAGERHHAAEGLQDHVVPGRACQRPGAAKAGNAAVDQAVVEAAQRGGVDAQALGQLAAQKSAAAQDGDVHAAAPSVARRLPGRERQAKVGG